MVSSILALPLPNLDLATTRATLGPTLKCQLLIRRMTTSAVETSVVREIKDYRTLKIWSGRRDNGLVDSGP